MGLEPHAGEPRATDRHGRARNVQLSAGLIGLAGLACFAGTSAEGFVAGLVDGVLRIAFWGALLTASARLAAWTVGSRLRGLSHLAWDGISGVVLLVALLLAVGLLPFGFRAETMTLVIGAVITLAVWRIRVDSVDRFRNAPPSVESACLAVVLVVVALVGLTWNRVPPVFFDALAYHFAQPELWLAEGRIAPQSWSLHSWFPPGMSVLYGVGMAAGGTAWANDANVVVGLLLLAVVFDVGRRSSGVGGGIVATLLLLSTPMILYAFGIPAADLGHGAFTFAAVAALLARPSADASWIRRAGICAAGAVLTKYLGVLAPLTVGSVWLALSPGFRPRGEALPRTREMALFVVPSLLLVGPWLVANTVVVHNPVAPVASRLLPTEGLEPGGLERFETDARGGFPRLEDGGRLASRLFLGDPGEARLYPTPAWGWAPVLLAFLLPVAWREQQRSRAYLGAAFLLFLLWFLTFRWERFLVATTALLCVGLAGATIAIWRRGGPWRLLPVAAAVLAVVSAGLATVQIARFTGGVPVALGQATSREFLERAWPTMRLYRWAGETLDPASQILLVGEMRHYGLGDLARCAPTGFNSHPLVELLDSGASPSRGLREAGFTHVIIDLGWVERSARDYPSLALLRNRPELLHSYLGSLGSARAVEGSAALFDIPP